MELGDDALYVDAGRSRGLGDDCRVAGVAVADGRHHVGDRGRLLRVSELIAQRAGLLLKVGEGRCSRPETAGGGDEGEEGMGGLERMASTGRVAGEELGEADGAGVGRARGELRGARGGHAVPAGEHPQGQLDDAEDRTTPPERRRLLRRGGAHHRADAGLEPEAAQERGTSWSTSP